MNARRTPADILTTHAADEVTDFPRNAGRPLLPLRIFHVQNIRNALRCHATTVSALTMTREYRQSDQTRESQIHRSRSLGFNRERFYRALQNPDLPTEGNVLKLESRSSL